MLNSSGSISQPYEFVGREGYYRESVFNLYLLGQRWYDSEVGRFISRDPIGEKGGINLYVYVRNNPLIFVDPHGEDIYTIGRIISCLACAYLIYEDIKGSWDTYKEMLEKCSQLENLCDKVECYVITLGKILWDQFGPDTPDKYVKDFACSLCFGGPKLIKKAVQIAKDLVVRVRLNPVVKPTPGF